ncbi:GGDEF family protein [Vibrio sinaloensis DSM 21326]|uniref:GGDEF family protein n=1 Tax=Vibrio sinaloensis DSM 21326 TaxID=945550 RepID=E8M2U1_PHOS4|nr:sensor domain-containing diguanylate cyclase [Vibrio sinaloensis]EGA71599.1 GGDEF family protein [Vibrio sinaloensis DSM 21326]
MKEPTSPNNEALRVKQLQQLNILDTQPEERFDRVTRLAKRLFDVPIAVVSLVDSNRQWFKSCFGLTVSETPRNISFCGHAILGDEPFIIPNALEDERFADNPLVTGEPNIRFYAGVPLVYQDNTKLGTLCIIDSKPREFSSQEIQDLIDLAKIAEQELANSLAATTDSLTGISNRRGFEELASKSLDYCRAGGFSISLAYFDLNDFKQINDNYGHQAGDQALVQFASLLKSSFRESDVIARVGGDEFVVLMSGASEKGATFAINSFKDSLQAQNATNACDFNISFSVGLVATKANASVTLENLIEQADQRMYQSKKRL